MNFALRFVFSDRTGIELVRIEMAILVGNWLAAIDDAVRSANISRRQSLKVIRNSNSANSVSICLLGRYQHFLDKNETKFM